MKIEDFEIGKCYSVGDDGLYKVVAKGCDWLCILSYSYNHCSCSSEIVSVEWCDGDWHEETDDWITEIFDNLEYAGYNFLKDK
jgi:hypothetical protein